MKTGAAMGLVLAALLGATGEARGQDCGQTAEGFEAWLDGFQRGAVERGVPGQRA